MLDTLRLTLGDFEIAPDADLEVQPSVFNAKTGELRGRYPLFRRGSGFVEGERAFHNGDDINVTVKPFSPSEPQSVGCCLQFSVSKVANGSNYEPANFKTTEASLTAAESYLRSIGINTNIETAKISRLDACKNVLTSEAFPAYAPVLARLQGTRMNQRGYGTSFLWENTLHQISVYDKREEMRHRKKNLVGVPQNIVRFEHRLLKARKVRDVLGFDTAGDLLIGFDEVERGYVTAMEKQLFRDSVAEMEIRTVQDFETDLLILKIAGIRNYVAAFISIQGLKILSSDMEALLTAVENVSDSRMTLHRTTKMLREAHMNALSLQRESTSKHTLGELYRELKRGVLSV